MYRHRARHHSNRHGSTGASASLEGETKWLLTHPTTAGLTHTPSWEIRAFLSARTCPKTISNWNVSNYSHVSGYAPRKEPKTYHTPGITLPLISENRPNLRTRYPREGWITARLPQRVQAPGQSFNLFSARDIPFWIDLSLSRVDLCLRRTINRCA